MPMNDATYDLINDTFKRLKRIYNTNVFDTYIDDLIPYEAVRRLSNNKMFDDDDKKLLRDLYNNIYSEYNRWGDDCEY